MPTECTAPGLKDVPVEASATPGQITTECLAIWSSCHVDLISLVSRGNAGGGEIEVNSTTAIFNRTSDLLLLYTIAI